MHDGIDAAQCRRPLRWSITADQFRQVAENWLSPSPADEVGGAVRAGERTHLVPPRTDQSPNQVLPDESTATRDEKVASVSPFILLQII